MKQTFRHSFTSRFLFSGISSHLYYQDWTVDDLLGELAKQAIDAYEVGVLEPWIECSKKRSGIPTTGKYSKFSIHTTNICIVLYVIFYVIWSMSNNYIYMVIYYIYIWPEPSQQKSPGWFLCCSIRILEAPSCAWSMSGPREIGYSYARFLIWFDDRDFLSFQTLTT